MSIRAKKEKDYPKIAFCSAITPATSEHYANLKASGIDTVSVCLHLSSYNYYKFSTLHTDLARRAGMVTHAYLHTDLYNPFEDVAKFTQRFDALGFNSSTKITILVNGDRYVEEREEKIIKIMKLLEKYHPLENIDLAFFKADIDAQLYDLRKVPQMINLTIINCQPYATEAGIPVAGTWVYTSEYLDQIQLVGYDFYSYYTSGGYQLSLIDTEYVAQKGDTWHSISRRHGIPMIDLLNLNSALLEDKIYEGQVIKIA